MTKKFLIIGLLVLLSILLINVTEVNAANFEFTCNTGLNNETYNLNIPDCEEWNYVKTRPYFIHKSNDSNLFVFYLFENDCCYFYRDSITTAVIAHCDTCDTSRVRYIYNLSEGTFVLGDPSDYNPYANNGMGGGVVYFNCDIYTDINKTELFFQGPPVTKTTELVEKMTEGLQKDNPLQEVVAILPLIIVILVSLVGLRKALRMLQTFLRAS